MAMSYQREKLHGVQYQAQELLKDCVRATWAESDFHRRDLLKRILKMEKAIMEYLDAVEESENEN